MAILTINSFSGSYRWLSNFYPAPVQFDHVLYPSVEYAFQAAKTLSADERARILSAETAGRAKRLGRRATLRPGWDGMKNGVMLRLLQQKFSSGLLREKLRATGSAYLVEGNDWGDTYWGVDDFSGEGHNHLGKLLMQVRSEIVNGQ